MYFFQDDLPHVTCFVSQNINHVTSSFGIQNIRLNVGEYYAIRFTNLSYLHVYLLYERLEHNPPKPNLFYKAINYVIEYSERK